MAGEDLHLFDSKSTTRHDSCRIQSEEYSIIYSAIFDDDARFASYSNWWTMFVQGQLLLGEGAQLCDRQKRLREGDILGIGGRKADRMRTGRAVILGLRHSHFEVGRKGS